MYILYQTEFSFCAQASLVLCKPTYIFTCSFSSEFVMVLDAGVSGMCQTVTYLVISGIELLLSYTVYIHVPYLLHEQDAFIWLHTCTSFIASMSACVMKCSRFYCYFNLEMRTKISCTVVHFIQYSDVASTRVQKRMLGKQNIILLKCSFTVCN